MTIRLPEDLENYIHARVQSGRFASDEEAVSEAVRRFRQWEQEQARQEAQAAVELAEPLPSVKPIWEEILELTADVPDEKFDRLPTDGAEQHDHYLYGTPKRPVAR